MSDEEIKDDDFEEVELQEEGGQEAASTGDGTGDAEEAPSGEAR